MIDEKQLITELELEIGETYNCDIGYGLKRAIEIVEHRPLVGEWIPCSSGKLPEDGRSVVVMLAHTYDSIYTNYSIARYIDCSNGEFHWCDEHHGWLEWDKYSDGRGGSSHYKVVAWMPLPEAYKEEVTE